jgi:hypothetical protein
MRDDSGAHRATFWLPSELAVAIDSLRGMSSGAMNINDRGQIVGYVTFRNASDYSAAV